MLDIRDMSEKHKVFYFVEGLKPWAKTKLYEQKVQDPTFALAAVERLFDYDGDQGSQKKNVTTLNPKNMISKPNPPTNFTIDKKKTTYLKL